MSRRPRSRTWGRASALPAAACALALTFAALAEIPSAAERHALTLEPAGMPVRLENATFFDDGRVLAWVWRNSRREALYPRLRVFVFDERGRLAGSLQRCTASPLQPGTRAQVRVELEIEGVTSRHRFVALVEDARSAATVWRVEGGRRAHCRVRAERRKGSFVSLRLRSRRSRRTRRLPPVRTGRIHLHAGVLPGWMFAGLHVQVTATATSGHRQP